MSQTVRQQTHLRSALVREAEERLDSVRGIDVAIAVIACVLLLGIVIQQCAGCFA